MTACAARRSRATAGQLATARQAASLLLGYPDEELLARLPLLRAAVAPLPARSPGRCGRFLDHLDDHAAGRAAGRLRRDLRPAPPLLPLPDLLHPRGHPQARHGAAAVQARVPPRGHDARRTANCPTTWPSCCEFAATGDAGPGLRLLRRAPAPASSCCGWRWRTRGSPYAAVLRGGLAPPCRRWTPPTARRSCGWPRRARPARRSASTRTAPHRSRRRSTWSPRRVPGAPDEHRRHPALGRSSRTSAWRSSSVGHIWRYRYDKFGWTTRSSPAVRAPAAAAGGARCSTSGSCSCSLGHVGGLLASRSRGPTRSGISETAYHAVAIVTRRRRRRLHPGRAGAS